MRLSGPAATERVGAEVDRISLVHTGSLGRVDELVCGGHRRGRGASWHSAKFHIVVPVAGAFVWHAGCGDIVADVNQVLFVPEDEEAAFSHPLGSERSVVITPRSDLRERIDAMGSQLTRRMAGRSNARVASYQAQLAVRRLLMAATHTAEALENDERLIEAIILLNATDEAPVPVVAGRARATVERAKAFLHAHPTDAISLADVATATGVCPVYLTQLFSRAEGLPLYQYVLKLRLVTALAALPRCEDITTLAFELGFSSHSHFSSVFRKRFGMSPSRYRREAADDPLSIAGRPLTSGAAQSAAAFIRSDPLCVARGGHEEASRLVADTAH